MVGVGPALIAGSDLLSNAGEIYRRKKNDALYGCIGFKVSIQSDMSLLILESISNYSIYFRENGIVFVAFLETELFVLIVVFELLL